MFLLLVFLIGLSSGLNGLSTADDDCLGSVRNWTIDEFEFGDYKTKRYHSIQLWDNDVDDFFSVPDHVYDSMMNIMGARQDGFMYGVECNGTYPDMIFNFNGGQLQIPYSDFIDQDIRFRDLCRTKIDDVSIVTGFDYNLPTKYKARVCEIINGGGIKY